MITAPGFDRRVARGVSGRFGVLELREPHLQNLPHRHPAVAVFFDEDELLRIGQTGRNHHFSTSFQLVDQRRGVKVPGSCRRSLVFSGEIAPTPTEHSKLWPAFLLAPSPQ